ncbi:GMC family oxidoreductase [Burkholderia plantarii]|uniref:GMC family oxidoreductase n=1 Tax=Burkholderia plantarii TaxID=41899 RepID=UPI0018DD0796|nr:GMC family oxidoreductase [Burkholderia plantarii]MBI0329061.1 GMC family oxidoreductase [Burkholderia plantarii]
MSNLVFDYVIVGGGSAGAIIARRLADANLGTVLLVEAGRPDEGVPAMMDISRLFELDASTDWGFLASPTHATSRRLTYSRARMLGGCGNHNDCAYLVPPAADFDSWRELGAAGWSGADVAPYFERLRERVTIERRPEQHPVSRAFLAGGVELGLPKVDFSRGVETGIGMLTLNARGRLRSSSSVAYLHPLDALPPNLTIFTDTLVSRLEFRERVATACLTSRGRIAARREIIVSAGSIQSPQLLLTSGIGAADELRALGIGVVHDSPGVGRHLIDHYSVPVVFETAEPVADWDVTPYEAIAMLTTSAGARAAESQVQLGLTSGWVNGRFGDEYDPAAPKQRSVIALEPNVARSRSEGSVRISSPDIGVAPVIDLNYLSDADGYDESVLLESVRFCRRLGQTESFGRLLRRELSPGPDVADEAALRAYIREHCQTYYHASGTCRAGAANDPLAVLTPDLKVKGVTGLRVCDASVFPAMVSVNINATVMMVGEKAADLIISEAKAAAFAGHGGEAATH